MNELEQIKKQFSDMDKIPMFEIPVMNKKTGEKDHVIFNISIISCKLDATHESFSDEQSKSNKIAREFIYIDPDFSLDENLQELYDTCIQAIINSEYFDLLED